MDTKQSGSVAVGTRIVHSFWNSNLLRAIPKDLLYQVYDYLDWLWNNTQFIPCPMALVRSKFSSDSPLTDTHVLYIMMAWRESRVTKELRNT